MALYGLLQGNYLLDSRILVHRRALLPSNAGLTSIVTSVWLVDHPEVDAAFAEEQSGA